MWVDLERLPVVLRGALQVALIDQALRNHLLHTGRTRRKDRQLVQRVVGQIGINPLRHVQDFDIVRVEIYKRPHHRSSAVEVTLLVVDISQFQSRLDLQVFVFQSGK